MDKKHSFFDKNGGEWLIFRLKYKEKNLFPVFWRKKPSAFDRSPLTFHYLCSAERKMFFMSIAILCLILCCYVLICFEHVTHVNKATIALFAGVVSWILLMIMGSVDHVNAFTTHGADMCGIALFLLATTHIALLLDVNNCFDFIPSIIRTRNSTHILWGMVLFTFLLSTNIDNLTATVLMLMIMHKVVDEGRWRMWVGAAIVIAANCGGACSVIGDVTSLTIWCKGAITPTDFSMALVPSAVVATVVPTFFISLALPERLEVVRPTFLYRGDMYRHPLWQRIVLLVVGLGGLWFIPSFTRITQLPPYLGALSVLGVLWVSHELFNLHQIRTDQPMEVSGLRRLSNAGVQTIMYFVGIYMAVTALIETGTMASLSEWCDEWIHNIYVMSLAMGAISAFLDNIALVLTGANIYPVLQDATATLSGMDPEYLQAFLKDGGYWHLIIYSGCIGGCLLPIGNVAGYALMKSEDVDISWYAKHIMPKVLVGWGLGLVVYFMLATP